MSDTITKIVKHLNSKNTVLKILFNGFSVESENAEFVFENDKGKQKKVSGVIENKCKGIYTVELSPENEKQKIVSVLEHILKDEVIDSDNLMLFHNTIIERETGISAEPDFEDHKESLRGYKLISKEGLGISDDLVYQLKDPIELSVYNSKKRKSAVELKENDINNEFFEALLNKFQTVWHNEV